MINPAWSLLCATNHIPESFYSIHFCLCVFNFIRKGKTRVAKRKDPFLVHANIYIPFQFSTLELTTFWVSHPDYLYLVPVIPRFWLHEACVNLLKLLNLSGFILTSKGYYIHIHSIQRKRKAQKNHYAKKTSKPNSLFIIKFGKHCLLKVFQRLKSFWNASNNNYNFKKEKGIFNHILCIFIGGCHWKKEIGSQCSW